jgi:hypothetical protein
MPEESSEEYSDRRSDQGSSSNKFSYNDKMVVGKPAKGDNNGKVLPAPRVSTVNIDKINSAPNKESFCKFSATNIVAPE